MSPLVRLGVFMSFSGTKAKQFLTFWNWQTNLWNYVLELLFKTKKTFICLRNQDFCGGACGCRSVSTSMLTDQTGIKFWMSIYYPWGMIPIPFCAFVLHSSRQFIFNIDGQIFRKFPGDIHGALTKSPDVTGNPLFSPMYTEQTILSRFSLKFLTKMRTFFHVPLLSPSGQKVNLCSKYITL